MNWALIVLYNKFICNSITFNSLVKYKKKLKLIVFDNSNKEYLNKNKKYCQNHQIEYLTLNKNVGLSKAYNYVINYIKGNNSKYLFLFDDDTEITGRYLEEALDLTLQNKYDVILPVIKASNHIISPSNIRFGIKYNEVKDVKELRIPNIDAINTGMIVNMKVYDKFQYDENLFLDDVDHAFMFNVRKNKFKIYVMNSEIKQNFSRKSKNNLESEKARFKIWLKDHRYYCFWRKKIIFYYLSTLKHRIREFIKYDFNIFFLIYK